MARSLIPAKFRPDMKVVVGSVAALYVAALVFAFVPAISPGAIVQKLGK